MRLFGWSSWSYLAPQALMGVAAVGLTYDLTRRVFGAPGASRGARARAHADGRGDLPPQQPGCRARALHHLAVWALVRGLQEGRTRWLVLAGVAVGLGFEAKMAAALLVVPGLVAAWLWVRPGVGC